MVRIFSFGLKYIRALKLINHNLLNSFDCIREQNLSIL